MVRGEEGPLQRQLLLCFALAPVRALRGGSRIDRTVMAAMQVEIKFLRLFQEVAIGDHIDGWRVCWIGRALMSSISIELAED